MDLLPTSIPLHCNICTKKPDFSDISHLLTHVASKGHLSNYYKMKVQSSSDANARREVEEYDEWYEEWNVDDLMRERMNQKDKRKGVTSGNVSRRGSGATTGSARSTPAPVAPKPRRPRQLRDSLLNPQLDHQVKAEPLSRSATPGSALIDSQAYLHGYYAPPMQSWPSAPYAGSPMKIESVSSPRSSDSFRLEEEQEQETSQSTRRSHRRLASISNGSEVNDDDWEMDETTSDSAKLKGVLWPGMALFDSATPDMKRKRNQKKDYSVIEQLMATSEYIEPTEMVFDMTGRLRRERNINGNPDLDESDSPLSGEAEPSPEPQAKKRSIRPPRRPRQALAEKNVNNGRATRRRTGPHHPSSRRAAARGPVYDGPVEDDDDLTFAQPKPKRRTGLSIHRDNSGPEITFDQPAPFNYLTSSFRNPFQAGPNVTQQARPVSSQGTFGHGHQRLPSLTQGGSMYGGSFRPMTAGNYPPIKDYASFGQLNTHNLFHSHLINNAPPMNGATALAAFQQQFGSQSLGNDLNNGHRQTSSQAPHNLSWDVFGISNQQDMGFSGQGENSFPAGTELNPLFFSSTQAGPPDDDQATVSPPRSER